METSEDEVRREIAQGAERFEEGGRSIMQSLCVGLARLGCVVFHYDMIGYADSQQITTELAHGFRTQRPEMNADEGGGLFSPQAEAHLQGIMGLQTWNSMRSLDFLLSLPEVDPERVACTGASGGGTQTFILSALDSRVKLAFPAVMVSTAMQGGCTCENASLLRESLYRAQMTLAHALVLQGRTDEARAITEVEIPRYQAELKDGAGGLAFSKDYAYALYVDALARPAGDPRRGSNLASALRQLDAMSEEVNRLVDIRELRSRIENARSG